MFVNNRASIGPSPASLEMKLQYSSDRAFLYLFEHTCVYLSVYRVTYLWRQETNLRCHSSGAAHHLFIIYLRWGPLLDLKLLDLIRQVASEPQGYACLCFPTTGIVSMCYHIWL